MRLLTTIFCLLILSSTSYAQKTFSEGSIIYDVYMNGNKASSGTYTVIIKDNNIMRSLKLFNGVQSDNIFNGTDGTSADLRMVQGEAYALVMSAEEVRQKNERFQNPTYNFKSKIKSYAAYNCTEGEVIYKDGSTASFFYTKDLMPQSENILAMFPGLKGIPLQYEISKENSKLEFIGRSVEFKNVDSDIFKIPATHKVVTQDELNRFK